PAAPAPATPEPEPALPDPEPALPEPEPALPDPEPALPEPEPAAPALEPAAPWPLPALPGVPPGLGLPLEQAPSHRATAREPAMRREASGVFMIRASLLGIGRAEAGDLVNPK